MANINCPMCSKPNPDELSVCQFCEARLKPLVAPSSQKDIKSDPSDETPEKNSTFTDWLSSLRDDEEQQPSAEDIHGLRPEDTTEGDEDLLTDDFASESHAWLDRIKDGADTERPLVEPSIPTPQDDISVGEPESEDSPEWLQRIRDLRSSEFSDKDSPSHRKTDIDTGDFLDRIRSLREDDQEITESDPADDFPDWLSKLASTSTVLESGDTIETKSPKDEATFPDWQSESDEKEISHIAPPSKSKQLEDEISEWFSDPEMDKPDRLSSTDEWESAPSIERDTSPPSPATEDSIPDWISDMATGDDIDIFGTEVDIETDLQQPDEEEPETHPPVVDEEEPLPGLPTQEDAEEEIKPFLLDSLPDWMSDGSSEIVTDREPKIAQSDSQTHLTQADLPSWLEAMRPTEAVPLSTPLPDEEDIIIESAGPLVGLSSILPAEPEIARMMKPPKSSGRVRVSESQQNRAKLLKEILAAEDQELPIPSISKGSSQRVFRWVIALVLILAIAITIISNSTQVPLLNTNFIPPEVLDVDRIIHNLPTDAPVLLVVDYDPGLSGEMDAAAAAVIHNIMLKRSLLTLVSTSPNGPLVAERFINNVLYESDYKRGERYINLGFIPGGSAGILSFVELPQRVKPTTLNGEDAWKTKPLINVKTIADFSLVLIASDNFETTRAWIEQIYKKIGDTPLILIVSAQVGPLIRPYYMSDLTQVHGFLSGLAGGAAYEHLTGQNNLARTYWDAFSIFMLIAVASILAGGIVNVIYSLIKQKREAKG